MYKVNNFINGNFVSTVNYIDSINPATGEICAQVSNSTANDVDTAVKAAKKAFKGYSQVPNIREGT